MAEVPAALSYCRTAENYGLCSAFTGRAQPNLCVPRFSSISARQTWRREPRVDLIPTAPVISKAAIPDPHLKPDRPLAAQSSPFGTLNEWSLSRRWGLVRTLASGAITDRQLMASNEGAVRPSHPIHRRKRPKSLAFVHLNRSETTLQRPNQFLLVSGGPSFVSILSSRIVRAVRTVLKYSDTALPGFTCYARYRRHPRSWVGFPTAFQYPGDADRSATNNNAVSQILLSRR